MTKSGNSSGLRSGPNLLSAKPFRWILSALASILGNPVSNAADGINRIEATINDIAEAITNQGVDILPGDTFEDDYATRISEIEGGGDPKELYLIMPVVEGSLSAEITVATGSGGTITGFSSGGLDITNVEVDETPVNTPFAVATGNVLHIDFDEATEDTTIIAEGYYE